MSRTEPLEFGAFAGIDWADQKHDISLQVHGSEKVGHIRLDHTPEAIAEWVAQLRSRFEGARVAIALETSRGPLVHALLEYEFLVLFPINPRSLARFREVFFPSGAKDDRPDSLLLLEILTKHRDRLRPWLPDDEATRALRRLGQDRRKMVDLSTKLTLQLRAALKEYFPQALSWAGEDLSSPLACDFLLKWPTLQDLQRVKPKTLRAFFYAHNSRRPDLIEQRIQEIQHARPLTGDPAILQSSVLLVQTLCRQLKALHPSIDHFDREIRKRFDAHPDAEIFRSFPGSGPALAPRMLAVFGSDRDHFDSAEDVQLLAGIAPVTERSGKRTHVHWRWSASAFQRQSFHEFAGHSIRYCAWAYYDLQRERGKTHHVAVRSLAFKWLRIIWRCWKDRVPYDDKAYVQALRAAGSPLVARMTSAS